MFTNIFNGCPIENALTAAAANGYEAVELQAISHMKIGTKIQKLKATKSMMSDLGLILAGVYTPVWNRHCQENQEFEKQFEDYRQYLDMAHELESPWIKIGAGGPSPDYATDKYFHNSSSWLKNAADLARNAGMNILVEIHFNTLVETVSSTLKLIHLVDRRNFGLIYDAANLYVANDNSIFESIRTLKPYIQHVHLKDVKEIDNKNIPGIFSFRNRNYAIQIFGDGEVDNETAIKALEDIGYDGFVSVEGCPNGIAPDKMAEFSFSRLIKILNDKETLSKASTQKHRNFKKSEE